MLVIESKLNQSRSLSFGDYDEDRDRLLEMQTNMTKQISAWDELLKIATEKYEEALEAKNGIVSALKKGESVKVYRLIKENTFKTFVDMVKTKFVAENVKSIDPEILVSIQVANKAAIKDQNNLADRLSQNDLPLNEDPGAGDMPIDESGQDDDSRLGDEKTDLTDNVSNLGAINDTLKAVVQKTEESSVEEDNEFTQFAKQVHDAVIGGNLDDVIGGIRGLAADPESNLGTLKIFSSVIHGILAGKETSEVLRSIEIPLKNLSDVALKEGQLFKVLNNAANGFGKYEYYNYIVLLSDLLDKIILKREGKNEDSEWINKANDEYTKALKSSKSKKTLASKLSLAAQKMAKAIEARQAKRSKKGKADPQKGNEPPAGNRRSNRLLGNDSKQVKI